METNMNKTSVTKYKNGEFVSVTYPEPSLTEKRGNGAKRKLNSKSKKNKPLLQEDEESEK